MSNKVFIANLPKDAKESELKDMFSKVSLRELFLIGSMELFVKPVF